MGFGYKSWLRKMRGLPEHHKEDVRERGVELVTVALVTALFLLVMGGIGTTVVAPTVDESQTLGSSTQNVMGKAHEFGKGENGKVEGATKPAPSQKPSDGDNGTTDKPAPAAGDQTIYVDVTYDYADGATEAKAARYAFGDAITLETPTRHGYYFKSWVSSANGRTYAGGRTVTMKQNTTLQAVWEKHGWGKWTVDTEPGCTTNGLKHRECPEADCTDVETAEIPATGHTWTAQPAADPTCVSEGHTAYELCSACGEKRGYKTTGVATGENGHNWVVVSGKSATCTNIGWKKHKVCSYCGKKQKYTELPALGHNYGKATCLAPATCTRCGATTGSKLEHNYVYYSGSSPTCTSGGWTSGTYCTNGCGYDSSSYIPALGHDVEGGYSDKFYYCDKCGAFTGLERWWYCSRCGVLVNHDSYFENHTCKSSSSSSDSSKKSSSSKSSTSKSGSSKSGSSKSSKSKK